MKITGRAHCDRLANEPFAAGVGPLSLLPAQYRIIVRSPAHVAYWTEMSQPTLFTIRRRFDPFSNC
jgi:hypothetical protein